ncbi:uncharacterized protein VICG_01120 [Vittaforma corneae ATCC 50505]|uniref:Uncharacterized protein n=1 Tax=Vittaforma corneae (strain ATCC 50505) TaxID=993615 RepID=L2GLK6_VITCO|nr:uncharacterized protein VICG_01120 [Vittaforma corneae ATCC 50505]ELA41768.1 hypothetical protein VICG_01120 [Vittaforma corneae ATCC 50505]
MKNTMLILYFTLIFGFLPLRLKDIRVALANQAYPSKVLTISKADLIHKEYKMLEIKILSKDMLNSQIFTLQEAWSGGVVFKTLDGLRSFRHFDTIKYKPFTNNSHDPNIYIIKAGTKYPRTFQIVSGMECLDAVESYNKDAIIAKFNECNNTESQLWGAFTEDQVRGYLGLNTTLEDKNEENLKRMIDMIDEKSLNEIIK